MVGGREEEGERDSERERERSEDEICGSYGQNNVSTQLCFVTVACTDIVVLDTSLIRANF